MAWRDLIVSENLDVKGKTANNIMQWYYADSLVVNRRYQRKLVWTLQENRLFIDSIINLYPTPSIILSTYEEKNEDGKMVDCYEIIDGLQRLNAIVRFVNNEYGIMLDDKEYYFDMQYVPTAYTKKLNGELIQKEPVLSPDMCNAFVDAELPVILTVQKEDRNKKIEQIFSRINSSGRKLSAHDLRQASSAGEFPDLVRRVAMNIRGDFTYYDEVRLGDMPKISIGSQGLNYGIDPESIFWRRHDIIPFGNLRQSKDEEMIASVLAMLLLGKDFRINADKLDSLYHDGSENFIKITEKIIDVGKTVIEQNSKDVISQIDNIFNSVNSNFTDYLYPKKDAAGKDVSFIILFYVIYKLNREAFFVDDFEKVAKKLKSCFGSTFALISNDSKHANRIRVIDVLYSSLKEVMTRHLSRGKNEDDVLLEKLLSLSPVESQMVEFKIGISYFTSGKVNTKVIEKIGKTLVAMANTKCSFMEEGYVILGVADSPSSCNQWKAAYGEMQLVYGAHQIVGIEQEAEGYFNGIDNYSRRVCDLISQSPITDELRDYVLSNMRVVDFEGKVLLLLPSKYRGVPCYYGNELYIRKSSKTVHVKAKDRNAVK